MHHPASTQSRGYELRTLGSENYYIRIKKLLLKVKLGGEQLRLRIVSFIMENNMYVIHNARYSCCTLPKCIIHLNFCIAGS